MNQVCATIFVGRGKKECGRRVEFSSIRNTLPLGCAGGVIDRYLELRGWRQLILGAAGDRAGSAAAAINAGFFLGYGHGAAAITADRVSHQLPRSRGEIFYM